MKYSSFAIALFAALLGARSYAGRLEDPPKPVEPAIEITVYAATSTRDALVELEKLWAKDHRAKLVFNFGGSGDLARQIVAANKADVFLSADEIEMDRVRDAQLLLAGSRRDLLSNQLVVIEPFDAERPERTLFSKPFAVEALANPRIALVSLANPASVPAGRYARTWLEAKGQWTAVAPRVLPGVDVRAALAAVESGGAQVGIVYRTDAARSKKCRVVHAVPIDEGPRIAYPIGVLRGRPHQAAALEFVDFLRGARARDAWESFGFTPAAAAKSDSTPPERR